jgi:hypothetical protein
MPGIVLDVIMGMNWMNQMGVVIDVGSRTISLKEPIGEGTFQVVLPRRIDLGSTTCSVQTTLLAIELIPRTPPISRRPYPMPPNELAELKKQL